MLKKISNLAVLATGLFYAVGQVYLGASLAIDNKGAAGALGAIWVLESAVIWGSVGGPAGIGLGIFMGA